MMTNKRKLLVQVDEMESRHNYMVKPSEHHLTVYTHTDTRDPVYSSHVETNIGGPERIPQTQV